jgi:radical SAM-linked protein
LRLAIEGDLRFLSHRDCARVIERAAARARLPLAYTRGFNPHPILSLPCPRPVGVASRDDLAVLELTEPIGADEIVTRMNRHVPPGMIFTGAAMLDRGESPRPRRVCYEWPVPPGRSGPLRRKVQEFRLAERWPIERRTPPKRRGQPPRSRTVDLKLLVQGIAVDADTLCWTLAPSGDLWARPAELLDALGLDGCADLAAVVRTAVDYGLPGAPAAIADPPGAPLTHS